MQSAQVNWSEPQVIGYRSGLLFLAYYRSPLTYYLLSTDSQIAELVEIVKSFHKIGP
jgi:hypothetical protein